MMLGGRGCAAQATDEQTNRQPNREHRCIKPPALGNVDKTFL